MYNILICDDEQDIVNALKIYLSGGDYCLFEASNGREALEVVEKNDIHLILMDIMMPQLDGIAATAKLREKSNVPIILLTAKSESSDKVLGLNIGADDYVTKPFSIKQLYARMEAVLRRTVSDLKPLAEKFSWNDHDLQIDFEHNEVRKQDGLLSLTPSEWKILSAMVKYPEKVFTRNDLIDLVFCPDFDGYDRVIDTHIKNLRKKVETDPKSPVYVKTVHGLGYKFGGEEF